MHKRYDPVEFEYIKNKWASSTNPISVYVHSPFCPSICKYCIYAGVLLKDELTYSEYYNNYLPNIIDLYRPILEEKNNLIGNWFFGGGTPSMMKPETLKNILNLLPGFKESKGVKTFEIHPAYWTPELLDVLEEYHFDNAILCLQSFDRKTLIKQKRVPETQERIFELTKEIRKRNMNILVDIIAHMNQDHTDIGILENDLKLTFENICPDEISVQAIYQNKELRPMTLDAVLKNPYIQNGDYLIENFDGKHQYINIKECLTETIFDRIKNLKCLRLVNKNLKDKERYMSFVHHMDPQYLHTMSLDTLALGSYRNPYTQTHSNVSHFNYIECNNDNTEPTFKFIKSSFFDEVREVINFLEQYGEPPADFELLFKNRYFEEKEKPLLLDYKFAGHYPNTAGLIQKGIDSLTNEIKTSCNFIGNDIIINK